MQLKRFYNELYEKNMRLKEDNERLKEEVQRLKSDLKYIRSIARKKLGMVKADEIILTTEKVKKKDNKEKATK